MVVRSQRREKEKAGSQLSVCPLLIHRLRLCSLENWGVLLKGEVRVSPSPAQSPAIQNGRGTFSLLLLLSEHLTDCGMGCLVG
jgi:hypothetical protein